MSSAFFSAPADPRGAPCPCGAGPVLAACCGPVLDGGAVPTAEALMRSRYTAYVLGDEGHLVRSWHPSTRPARVDPAAGPEWVGLEVLAVHGGDVHDDEGVVEFRARHRHGAGFDEMREVSRFVRLPGVGWVYVDGEVG